MSIRQTQTVFQSTAEFHILDTIIKENKMLFVRLVLLYCVFIINGMCSDVNLDQFKSEMLTQFEIMKTQIELLKDSVDQCKIKPQYLTEELENQKSQVFL